MSLLQFNTNRPKTPDYHSYNSAEYQEYRKTYDAWYNTWKAKKVKNKIEIRKGVPGANILIIVTKMLNPLPKMESPYLISMSMNGTANLKDNDLNEIQQAIAEAKEILKD